MRISFFILFAGILLSSCANLTKNFIKDPEIKILDVSVKNISLEDVTVDLKLNVYNPNALSLDLDKVTYGLSFSGQKMTEGVSDKKIPLKANANNEVIIPLKFKYDAVGSLVKGFFKKSLTKNYEIKGTVDVGVFSIPFQKQGELEIGKK